MLKNSPEVLYWDDGVQFVLNLDFVKLIHLNRNRCVQRLFQNSCAWRYGMSDLISEFRERQTGQYTLASLDSL